MKREGNSTTYIEVNLYHEPGVGIHKFAFAPNYCSNLPHHIQPSLLQTSRVVFERPNEEKADAATLFHGSFLGGAINPLCTADSKSKSIRRDNRRYATTDYLVYA
ncbi:hypothetical protein GOBAR_AA09919 [Gossypium barbadense]|uniref:Uncharacterized protein n=1 Tax=Gossypium barbadense TaxID=3634 RepID=A0A2P5Y580_GOSBA|nr:hypothetical protein GOBAR_AA09919 [Gossypium barbadense]